jgi:hypothetical protein
MLRIQRSENGEVVFTLSGGMDEEATAQLEQLIRSEASGSRIVLDLKDVTLVGQEAAYPALSVTAPLSGAYSTWCGSWRRPTPRC